MQTKRKGQFSNPNNKQNPLKSSAPQQPIEKVCFTKSHEKISHDEQRLSTEILRVYSIEKLRSMGKIWELDKNEMCEFFTHYKVFPQDRAFSSQELLSADNLKLIKSEDKVYFGQITKKRRQGMGVSLMRDGKIYEGFFQKNQRTGYGIEVYPNGNLYLGEFLIGKKHGKGRFYWFNLNNPSNAIKNQKVEFYDGQWWGGLPDGQGIHQKISSDYYEGTFKNGLKHGKGQQLFASGDSYIGEYVNGLPEGYGEYKWFDGSLYKGDLKQGLRNGYGNWSLSQETTSENVQKYQGHYQADKKSGYGIYSWENDWVYKGNFDKDFRNGYGELYQDGELTYKGNWIDGERQEETLQKTQQKTFKNPKISRGFGIGRNSIGVQNYFQNNSRDIQQDDPLRNKERKSGSSQRQKNVYKSLNNLGKVVYRSVNIQNQKDLMGSLEVQKYGGKDDRIHRDRDLGSAFENFSKKQAKGSTWQPKSKSRIQDLTRKTVSKVKRPLKFKDKTDKSFQTHRPMSVNYRHGYYCGKKMQNESTMGSLINRHVGNGNFAKNVYVPSFPVTSR